MLAILYFTVLIPFARENATQWHPARPTGPLSVISRGAFGSEAEAHRWAAANIPGHAYEVKPVMGEVEEDRTLSRYVAIGDCAYAYAGEVAA